MGSHYVDSVYSRQLLVALMAIQSRPQSLVRFRFLRSLVGSLMGMGPVLELGMGSVLELGLGSFLELGLGPVMGLGPVVGRTSAAA